MSSVKVETKDLNRPYIYPMSNATNGGEAHTEYNVRSALSNLLSYSAAFSANDFLVGDFNYTNQSGVNGISLYISNGKGNCNAYFVSVDDFGTQSSPKFIPITPNDHLPNDFVMGSSIARFGLYLSIDYTQTIADGLCYRFICDGFKRDSSQAFTTEGTEYETIYNSFYKPQGFNDIGIKLGTVTYNGSTFSLFERNPSITRCIDIDRLGDEDEFSEKLSELITRLQVLNVYGGDFYISNTSNGDTFLTSSEIIDSLGADFRLRLHIDISDDININEWDKDNYFNFYVLPDSTKPNAESDISVLFNRAIYGKTTEGNTITWQTTFPLYNIRRRVSGQEYEISGNDQKYRFSNDISTYSDTHMIYINYSNTTLRGAYQYLNHALLYDAGTSGAYYAQNLYLVETFDTTTEEYQDPVSGETYSGTESTSYVYSTNINDVPYLNFARYINGAWNVYSCIILDKEPEDISVLTLNTNYVVMYPNRNVYYYTESNEIKRHEQQPNDAFDFNYPVPISHYFFDNSGRNVFPTGTKVITGTVSLVKCNLGGEDEVLFDVATFSTEPFIAPFTGLDTIGQPVSININSDGVKFPQTLSVNNLIALGYIRTNDVKTSSITFNDGEATLFGGTDSSNNPAIITNNSIVANKVYGAVWM